MAARPLTEVADAAARVFRDIGYQAAGISDVSAALGLSHGAVYTYVSSKEALLYLALLRLVRPPALATLTIPVPAPPPDEVVALIDAWVANNATFPVLAEALRRRRIPPVAEELAAVIDELYEFIETKRDILGLVALCARNLPELAIRYFVQFRRAHFERLGDYLGRRIRSGHLREVPDVPTAARFIVETVAWFAWHRMGDPDSGMLDDDTCRRTVRHLLLAAYLKEAA